ncbi:Zn-dependent hydrolase [Saccharopolyspora sp. ASAGF58]|uniref:Zn-dependent hydrolase n=1 Tax=Saccharopolyspora sp. ASAGF58 TaxID=2719023 RepID=UPI001445F540|nr:Zn-dependent hydrolase [Saccharopolyspora sp. ASAGF58]
MTGFAVDPTAIASDVAALGRIGAQPDGGVTRTTYDPAWVQARDLVRKMMADRGLSVRVDAVGNVYGRLAGTDGSRTVLTGSHLDTVPNGGNYDGALGIVAGIAALDALNRDRGRPRDNVEVVAFVEEEGTRFGADFLGSRALVGGADPAELHATRDVDGVSVAEAMRAVGLDPGHIGEAKRTDLKAFLELHIEQGPVLEGTGTDLGVVDAITSLAVEDARVTGRADHAGTTPITHRADALRAAARMIVAADERARACGPPATATVGMCRVHPGGANIVAERAEFSLDARHPDPAVLGRLVEEIHQQWQAIAATEGVDLAITPRRVTDGALMDPGLGALLREAAGVCGASAWTLTSGAGHDSQVLAPHVPTGMLFVPSRAGRSHCPEEFTEPEHAAIGARVLATALHQLAY